MPFAWVSNYTTLTSKSLFWQAISRSLLTADALECVEARFTYQRPWTRRGLTPFLAKRQEPAKPLTLVGIVLAPGEEGRERAPFTSYAHTYPYLLRRRSILPARIARTIISL